MQEKYLSELAEQAVGVVKKINDYGILRQRLLHMGILPGCAFEIIKLAPFGGPMDIKIKGYHLSLRKEEAQKIIIE